MSSEFCNFSLVLFSEVLFVIIVKTMPRASNRITKRRKGVGGRKILVLASPNKPGLSSVARPRLLVVEPKSQERYL